jgi:glucan phosphoethanolaminetransferase (alkaline phosphatase superfamily)
MQWNWREAAFYAASILLVLAWTRVVAGLLPDRRHPWRYWPAIVVLGAVSGLILLIHFDYYFYFGVQPEIIGVGHLLEETGEATSVMMDEATPLRLAVGALLATAGSAAWHIAARQRPGRAGFWGALAAVILLAPAFQLNVAMSPGNFLPSVNLLFTAGKAIQYAAKGEGSFRRMQVSSRIPLPAQPGKLPFNVLLLINESLRARQTGYNGYSRDTTPRVDAFLKAHAGQAFNFRRCYTNSTQTSESVPSILTGVHAVEDYRKLHRYPLFYEYGEVFSGTHSFLFASHGYNVANFRFFLRTPRLDEMVYQENSGFPRFNSWGMDDRHLAAFLEKTLARLPPDTPFAGILHMNGPHFPYQVPGEARLWRGGTRQDDYDNAIRYQDQAIGMVLDALARHGRLANTVIFSTSDHGEAFGEHGVNGHRRMFYEEIIHIPCWLYLPRPLAEKHRAALRANLNANISNLDWVPTLADLLELHRVPQIARLLAEVQGRSLVRLVDPKRAILVQNGTNQRRLSEGFAVVKESWRLLNHPRGQTGQVELYDLAQDPEQRRDLWAQAAPATRRQWGALVAQFPILERRVAALIAPDGTGGSRAPR